MMVSRSGPDLASYDVIEVSTSAGKDSLAMLAHVAELARRADVLYRVVAVHADLGRVEWPGTLEIAKAQAEHLGVQFLAVRRPQGDFLDLVRHYGHWPKPDTRYCTAMLKRGQILRALTRLANEARAERGKPFCAGDAAAAQYKAPVRILNCVGLRAEESPGRARQPAFKPGGRGSGKGKRKVVDLWLPIHAWTEAEVWEACRASGAPIHPAYAAGLPRASCVFCIYAPREALVVAGKLHPELLAEYVAVEKEIGHAFKHKLPMAVVAEDVARGVATGPIANWRM
jgi:3'-phosphoadenosine 5'-phosphosulfate sulfotransferase (PAPS reductase)/FAD synthetase